MAQYIGFGNGSDGAATLSGTDAPIDSSCSGTAASTSLSATNASFSPGQIILIHQSRGSSAGTWEINQIGAYSAGTITTSIPLANTYTDSGADQAQVLVLKQYTSVTVSGTLTAKAWDGNVGGILSFLASGKVTVTGTITATGTGYRGGTTQNGGGTDGESEVGVGVSGSTTANGSGGGSGKIGQGGGQSGVAYMTTADFTDRFVFGGGGGGAELNGGGSGAAGNGGGIIFINASQFENSGTISSNGTSPSVRATAGGAGGAIFIRAINPILGSGLVVALGAAGTTGNSGDNGGAGGAGATNGGNSNGQNGGTGSDGAIRVEGCTISGTTNPSASTQEGGYSFCTVKHGIL